MRSCDGSGRAAASGARVDGRCCRAAAADPRPVGVRTLHNLLLVVGVWLNGVSGYRGVLRSICPDGVVIVCELTLHG